MPENVNANRVGRWRLSVRAMVTKCCQNWGPVAQHKVDSGDERREQKRSSDQPVCISGQALQAYRKPWPAPRFGQSAYLFCCCWSLGLLRKEEEEEEEEDEVDAHHEIRDRMLGQD